MKNIVAITSVLALVGCANTQIEQQIKNADSVQACLGSSSLPNNIANKFEAVEDEAFLNKTLGSPKKRISLPRASL